MNEWTNHKGQFCWIDSDKFCQEGYCPDCEIYHQAKLCPNPVCRAHLDNWLEMFGEPHSCNYHREGVK